MSSGGSTALRNHPYSTGVVLAVNAVADAYLLLDAPVCAQWRPGFIQGSHDAASTLWDPAGAHRVQISGTTTERLVSGNLEDISRKLAGLAAAPGCGAVLAAGPPEQVVRQDILRQAYDVEIDLVPVEGSPVPLVRAR